MDTIAMLFIFGPMIVYCLGVALAFGCYSYAAYKNKS